MRSGCDPNPLKEVWREQHIALITRNILGSCITLAALRGVDLDGVGKFIETTGNELATSAGKQPERTARQLQDAKDRYVFLDSG